MRAVNSGVAPLSGAEGGAAGLWRGGREGSQGCVHINGHSAVSRDSTHWRGPKQGGERVRGRLPWRTRAAAAGSKHSSAKNCEGGALNHELAPGSPEMGPGLPEGWKQRVGVWKLGGPPDPREGMR